MPDKGHDIAINRYGAVALVLAKVAAGKGLSQAILETTKDPIIGLNGSTLTPSKRTLFRWVSAYKNGGLDSLRPISRIPERASQVLSDDFLDFMTNEKEFDEDASIPELMRRAERLGLTMGTTSRVTAWRAAKRLNLPIFGDKGVDKKDMRRFAYLHRMQMVLCDGKRFRPGEKRPRRVAFVFLDDATRFALGGLVGTSESTVLFLGGLWSIINQWGLMSNLYTDNGSGFISNDTILVCARLGINLIHGTAGYAEGHGKIERFNQTMKHDLTRRLSGRPDVDTGNIALTLRLNHYLKNEYNRRRHEELKTSPEQRFLSDSLALNRPTDFDALRDHFRICRTHRVSRDNVISVDKIYYEMPRGHAGRYVDVYRHTLNDTVSIMHENKMMQLLPVDLALTAASGQERRPHRKKEKKADQRPIRSAADISFARDHQPLVDKDGGFSNNEE